MVDSVGVQVDGLRPLRKALRDLDGDLGDMKAAHAVALGIVVPAAAARARRRTGRLAASVRGNRSASRATVLAGGAAIPYAGVQEYGWPARNIEPHPFVTAAAHDTESAWLPAYEAEVNRAVDKVTGRTYQ